jgi:iron complex transport system permease protein
VLPKPPVQAASGDAGAGRGRARAARGHIRARPGSGVASAALAAAGRLRGGRPVIIATAVLMLALGAGVAIGPVAVPFGAIADTLARHLPWHPVVSVPRLYSAIIWQIRLPRVVLGALVGAMLAGGGAAYQGVFRNPLADPYLLGVAAGAGLGATAVIITGGSPSLLPVAAFGGAIGAVGLTYSLGAGAGRRGEDAGQRGAAGTASILLAGVAVAALLTAAQTYLQQAHSQALQSIYSWILGGLSGATWGQVKLITGYAIVSAAVLLAHRRLLDVLRVGETEAGTLGVNVPRLRLVVVVAATLGAAAAVSVSGLIGFVGIIVPHAVRLMAGPSYRVLLPVSMIGGAAFLVLADIAARTVQPDTEIPIGVITAVIGAPFFLFVLRSRRARADSS